MIPSLARYHAFAEQHLGTLHSALLDEVVVLHQQHLTYVVGMIEKQDVFGPKLVVSDVTEAVREILEQLDWVMGPKLTEGIPEQIVLQSRRKVILSQFFVLPNHSILIVHGTIKRISLQNIYLTICFHSN